MSEPPPRWRIGHLIKGLGRGGAESLLPQMIRHRSARFDYHVAYFLPWKDALVSEAERAGAAVECLRGRSASGILLATGRVVRWIRREKLDLVHCHLPLAGLSGRLAGRLAPVPVVYTEHNLQERYHPLTRWANRRTWLLQRAVVAVSGEVQRSIALRMPASIPVHLVHNGIELDSLGSSPEVARSLRRELGWSEESVVVGTVAVFRAQKRLDLWLESFAMLAAAEPRCRALLVGDGPLRGALERQAGELGIDHLVHFAGLQERVGRWLEAMDLFLVTSEYEGLPLAVLEAMAASRAVVATPAGGIPEVIEPEVSGILVGNSTAQALAHAAAGLIGNAERRRALGRAARARVEERFTVHRMQSEIETLYRQILLDAPSQVRVSSPTRAA
jgi:glycosyltransferase involved in cell wall biosynthesis